MIQKFEKPMKQAVDGAVNSSNGLFFTLRRWNPLAKDGHAISFGKWDGPMTCRYLMKRFWKLADEDRSKSAARNAVECGELALKFSPSLVTGEMSYIEVDGLKPLTTGFIPKLALQCARAASPESTDGLEYFKKAADYNERAAGLYGREKNFEYVAKQIGLAVENARKYSEGLEKLALGAENIGALEQDLKKAGELLKALEKKHCLAKAELEASDLLNNQGLRVEQRTIMEERVGRNYIAADELEKGVEHLLRAGWGFVLSGSYYDALRVYNNALPWASSIGKESTTVENNPWVRRVEVHRDAVSTLKQEANATDKEEIRERTAKVKEALDKFDVGWKRLMNGEDALAYERFPAAGRIGVSIAAAKEHHSKAMIYKSEGRLAEAFGEYLLAAEQFIDLRESEYARQMYLYAEMMWVGNGPLQKSIPNGLEQIGNGRKNLGKWRLPEPA